MTSAGPPVVVVAGPPSAGVSAVAAALVAHMPEIEVADGGPAADERVRIVVLVVSAGAPMTESDCALLADAAASADDAVAVVAKTDAHRRWREVLAENRTLFALRRDITWVGAAAAPPVGDPQVAELVAEVRRLLSGGRSRSAVTARLSAARAALDRDRSALGQPAVKLRAGLHRERSGLVLAVRERCARLRSDWRAAAAEAPRRGMEAFEEAVRAAADDALRDFDSMLAGRIDDLAELADLADVLTGPTVHTGPEREPRWTAPSASTMRFRTQRRAERGLTLALGAGFGLGVAVAVGRVLQGLPGPDLVGQLLGALVGVALTAWLVSTRELLHDRAALDRWVCEVVASLRGHADDLVARRLMDAELRLVAEASRRRAELAGDLNRRIGAIDKRLRSLPDPHRR